MDKLKLIMRILLIILLIIFVIYALIRLVFVIKAFYFAGSVIDIVFDSIKSLM